MIKWILYCIIDILFNLICYITNPFVLLFANEVGELPKIFKLWENWDDGLDIEWMITEHRVPKFAEYDFNRHYKYYTDWEAKKYHGREKGFVELLDPNFTLKERFQRYICRLVWLYRNCAYGFSYYVTGVIVDDNKLIDYLVDRTPGHQIVMRYYKNWWLWDPFVIWTEITWHTKDVFIFRWLGIDRDFNIKTFLGWKCQYIKKGETKRCMLALFPPYPYKEPF